LSNHEEGEAKMHHRVRLFLLLCAPAAMACFQTLDPSAASNAIAEPDGGAGEEDPAASRDPCGVTTAQARTILQTNCAPCHQAPAKQGNFDFCLDFDTLTRAVASTGKRFVVPGVPGESRLYQRVAAGEMPPVARSQRPTTSDLSVLHEWITSCLVPGPRASEGADGSSSGNDGGRAEEDGQAGVSEGGDGGGTADDGDVPSPGSDDGGAGGDGDGGAPP
jgi:hypothetical protein